MGGDGSGCGIGLLEVISNKLVTLPKQNSIRPSVSCCSVWGMYLHSNLEFKFMSNQVLKGNASRFYALILCTAPCWSAIGVSLSSSMLSSLCSLCYSNLYMQLHVCVGVGLHCTCTETWASPTVCVVMTEILLMYVSVYVRMLWTKFHAYIWSRDLCIKLH